MIAETKTETPKPGWTGRADYAARREARIDRLNDRAERHGAAANAAYNRARAAVAGIPLGQPNIGGKLTPCYKRHDSAMRASIRESDAAEHAAAAAKAAEKNTAISSDDPRALERLREKLENLETAQELMKTANAALRLKDTAVADAFLARLGFSPERIAKFRAPDFCGRVGFPDYALKNNNAQIHAVRQRIESLEKRANGPAPEGWSFDGGEVVCNVGENRVQIKYAAIPDEETRKRLKRCGFRWSRFAGVWQRQLTRNAIYDAKCVTGAYNR